MEPIKIKFSDFTLAEKLSLQKKLGVQNLLSEKQGLSGTRHGDLGINDVIVSLGPSVITILGVWLAKHRRRVLKEEHIEVLHPDGTVTKKTLKYYLSGSESDADVVKQIGDATRPETSPAQEPQQSKSSASEESDVGVESQKKRIGNRKPPSKKKRPLRAKDAKQK